MESQTKVFCRFRPKPTNKEDHDQGVLVIPATNSCVVGVSRSAAIETLNFLHYFNYTSAVNNFAIDLLLPGKNYTFDRVFQEEASQTQVYEGVKAIVEGNYW